jgi:predicted phosphoribosyltransferase
MARYAPAHFHDRRDAGRLLGERLADGAERDSLVIALPRGGVPVGAEVARVLDVPLEILAVRKIGAPKNPELGIGAIAEDGTAVLDESSASAMGMTQEMLDEAVAREVAELQRRVERYRGGRPAIGVAGRTAIVVDDGLATGLSDLAAVHALRKQAARRIVVAVPVASRESLRVLADAADETVCLLTPRTLFGVGLWYDDFSPVSDEEVLALLAQARARTRDAGAQSERTV